jgi:hypothetical protein
VSGPRGSNGMGELPGWAELEAAVPQVAATIRRYLTQIGCVLRRAASAARTWPCAASPRSWPRPHPG